MSQHFFAIPALNGDAEAEVLNTWLRTQRALQVERHLVADGARSFWAICVTVAEGPGPLPTSLKRGGREHGAGLEPNDRRIDYKTVLSPADFDLFSALRAWRKKAAEQEGVPLYALFSNQQLAAFAEQRCNSLAALHKVEGVGDARVQRYGAALLAELREAIARGSDLGA